MSGFTINDRIPDRPEPRPKSSTSPIEYNATSTRANNVSNKETVSMTLCYRGNKSISYVSHRVSTHHQLHTNTSFCSTFSGITPGVRPGNLRELLLIVIYSNTPPITSARKIVSVTCKDNKPAKS